MYLLVSLAATWPLAARSAHSLASDYGDPLFTTWAMGWVSAHLSAALRRPGELEHVIRPIVDVDGESGAVVIPDEIEEGVEVAFAWRETLSAILTAITDRAARVPEALVATGPDAAVPLLSGAGAALLALALPGPRDVASAQRPASRARVAAAGLGALSAALALGLAVTRPTLGPPPGRWWCVVLDVGQGDAIAIGCGGRWWLVDVGPRSPHHDAGQSVVLGGRTVHAVRFPCDCGQVATVYFEET